MKNILRTATLVAASVISFNQAQAQAPQCIGAGGYVYYLSGSSIYNYSPNLPISATNPTVNTLPFPSGGSGLAVSNNLNGVGPSPTFYTTIGGNYWYYNGTAFVNTGHSTGNTAAVNPTGAGPYIYNLVGGSGDVYRYDGTGPGTLAFTIPGFGGGGPYDLVGDCEGNVYVLKISTAGPGQSLTKYSPTGAVIQSWTLTGAPNGSAGVGLAVVDDTLYYHSGSAYKGYIGATNINVVSMPFPTPGPDNDFASCQIGGGSAQATIDTGYYCGTGPGVPVGAVGNPSGTYTWTVVSGNATLSSATGQNITITATTTSRIRLSAVGANVCPGTGFDTVTIVVPTATVEAGAARTLNGCGTYFDSLSAIVTNVTPNVNYTYSWAPAGAIVSGGNTLKPKINPTANTLYTLTVTSTQGGCTFQDTVSIFVNDQSPIADFDFALRPGCDEDSVDFTNLSTGPSALTYNWDFGDGNGSIQQEPTHIYANQNSYNVTLIASTTTCKDTVTKVVNISHPLAAAFTYSDDSICQNNQVVFTNTSVATAPMTQTWYFGDGGTDNSMAPVYTYTQSGVFTAMLVITDFIGCMDTAYHTIVVDTNTFVSFTISDTTLCEGQQVTFSPDYALVGNTGLTWDFGDGTTINNIDTVSHAYDEPGVYNVTLTATYRICPDITATTQLTFNPYPQVDLGPDTVLCPNGAPIQLFDHINNGGASYMWSTGATTSSIMANAIGTYWATVDRDGCATTDSVEVFKDCYVDVPNSFTPNGDGMNDYFLPRQLLSNSVNRFKMSIFNRWGELIFETSALNGRGWDGKVNGVDQPTGVYIYIIEADFTNGTGERYQGNVTLLR